MFKKLLQGKNKELTCVFKVVKNTTAHTALFSNSTALFSNRTLVFPLLKTKINNKFIKMIKGQLL